MASTVQNLEQQLRDLLQSGEKLREEQLLLWEQQSQYRTRDYVQEMMQITQAIAHNFERREEVCKKLEEAEHRVQKKVPILSNDAVEHTSLQQLNSKDADTFSVKQNDCTKKQMFSRINSTKR